MMARQIYGLIGHPVKHSLSPAMHNAAFKELGIDAGYSIFDVEPADLEGFLGDAAAGKISGLNVTIPHKLKARDYIGSRGLLDATAEKLGAVNTIKFEGKALRGFNTDGPGFYRSLLEELKFEPEGKDVFILGAGGAGQAIAMYLGNGPRKIFVSDMDAKKTTDLKTHFSRYYEEKKLEVVGPGDIKTALAGSQLLVNATPIGMKDSDALPVDASLLHPGLYVYDLVYNRPTTPLVKEAARKRLRAVTGLGMLLYQGAIAFEIWTGKKAPVAVMKRALREALKCQQ